MMAIDRPFYRTVRQFSDGKYGLSGKWKYIEDPRYAKSPEQYIRAYLLLLKDFQELTEYIEPADANLSVFSYRIHQLLLRTCVEVEANCKAILVANGYSKKDKKGEELDLNMTDYGKINSSHHLSSYQIWIPNWQGDEDLRTPFSTWAKSKPKLPWYTAYNATKHDRQNSFNQATLDHLLNAICGLSVLLSAQFWTIDFSPSDGFLKLEGNNDGMEDGVGKYFRVRFPDDWTVEEQYDFDWQSLENKSEPFQAFDYSKIP